MVRSYFLYEERHGREMKKSGNVKLFCMEVIITITAITASMVNTPKTAWASELLPAEQAAALPENTAAVAPEADSAQAENIAAPEAGNAQVENAAASGAGSAQVGNTAAGLVSEADSAQAENTAEAAPDASEAQAENTAALLPAQELPAFLTQTPSDHETALLQFAQAEVYMQGLPLEKYHIINVLGDSIAEGIGASGKEKSFPSVLAKLTGAQVNNYGVSCSRITDIVSDVSNPGSFVDRMYQMDKAADLIIVFGGTNDFWYGDCPIGKRTDTSPNTFYGALNTMITYLQSTYPNADIVFLTPYQQSKDADETHSYKRSTYGNFGTGTLSEYRTAMLDRCQFYGVPVLDLYADYELNTVDNRDALARYGQYLCDGVHLNDAGYNFLARKIYQFIMQDFADYTPVYTQVNNMVFETAALPSMICEGGFLLPDGSILPSKPDHVPDPSMPLKQLYHYLVIAAYL